MSTSQREGRLLARAGGLSSPSSAYEEAAREAVVLRRELARARPEAFTPNLATSLNNLATMLSELGHREEALTVAREAADHYREMARARPEAFIRNFAISLRTLINILIVHGQSEDAQAVAMELNTIQNKNNL